MARSLKDIMIRDAIILAVFIGLVVVLITVTGCSTQETGFCTTPSDCEGLDAPNIECVGDWKCLEGECVFSCTADRQETTGDNETDEIGNQLQKIEDTLDEMDMAYIDQLEKDIGSLTW